ncbi:MAG TPA: dTDP-4-dehydrorhamnose 3,5-epimerase [Longimicrobium sp.]|jgi:dTDP-4-dehydrorhamnose 3,5-epimerase|uniref:dTDP-4-dehydrorhamnose 3,5-epimerase n=1 Tax=Longimicrobium sp. TaxID=2029185 RepID=UPI002EDAC626
MNVRPTRLEGVLLLEPRVFRDDRGWFVESWSSERYQALGIPGPFVQDNLSFSRRGVLRGMHFQNPSPQGKLVSVPQGAVFDVAVDLRRGSPTFSQWVGVELSSENGHQLWVPAGFAHGFAVLSDTAVFSYKCTAPYTPAAERSLRWDDPDVGIVWPVAAPVLAAKDADAPRLRDLAPEALFGAPEAA